MWKYLEKYTEVVTCVIWIHFINLVTNKQLSNSLRQLLLSFTDDNPALQSPQPYPTQQYQPPPSYSDQQYPTVEPQPAVQVSRAVTFNYEIYLYTQVASYS